MYENLITPQPLSKNQNNFSVRFAPMPVSEKVMYVESVCASLIDNRFGRRLSPFLIDIRELPEQTAEVLYDLADAGALPSYVVHPGSETARRSAASIIRHELAHLRISTADVQFQIRSPSNLGRGSPKQLGTHPESIART